MGIKGSVYSIRRTDEHGNNIIVDTVYSGPTISQKEKGYTPKIIEAEDIPQPMIPEELFKSKPSTTQSREAKKKKANKKKKKK